MPVLLVAIGGAAGAATRYILDGWISNRASDAFPWGTLVINLSGSALLGMLFALAIERGVLPASIRGPLMVGFLGAYTTFSTVMLDSWRLWENGAVGLAAWNAFGSVVLGLFAVFVGLTIGRALG